LPQSKQDFRVCLPPNFDQSVKHLIESLGVPHTEVSKVTANGIQVDFHYLVQPGDQIDAYSISASDINSGDTDHIRFILDNHLGRLAVYLRMLGFDVLYRNDFQDEELAERCSDENRILLTRDKRLLMRKTIISGYWLRSKVPREQLEEVIRRYDLVRVTSPFQRCLRCNELLQIVEKKEILHRLEPLTQRYYDDFRICPACNQIYWKGSHYERMLQMINQVLLRDP
jgi:hypothetical protein